MLILGLETSCDETSLALVKCSGSLKSPRFEVLKNLVSSQIDIHRAFGGVVPNIAKREHEKILPILTEEIFSDTLAEKIDAIAVTVGPGLEPALHVGAEFAQRLSVEKGISLVAANHLKGHLYSFLLDNPKNVPDLFPSIALIVSGGHTILLLLSSLSEIKKLGETRDDAAGETYDKAARLLGLPYPGGPEIEKLAKLGNKDAIDFPRPMLNQKNYDFSFSGLKTSLLYHLKDSHKADWKSENKLAIEGALAPLPENAPDLCASFQAAIIDSLVKKTMRAVDEFGARSVIISGGVASNNTLREEFEVQTKKRKIKFFAPSKTFNTDNAAMIAAGAYVEHLAGIRRPYKVNGNLNLK